tara:strand:- start:166 stop:387 length:222 start_codon:yes stop_codon:yes gene_type:complete
MSWFSEKICQLQNLLHTQAPVFKNTPAAREADKGYGDFNELKVVELKSIAKEKGLKGYTGLRKAELIKMLQQN